MSGDGDRRGITVGQDEAGELELELELELGSGDVWRFWKDL